MTESTLTDKEVEELLRTKSGGDIVQQIWGNMKLFSVEAMKNKKNPIPAKPVLYRWWFPEDSKVCDAIRKHSEGILEQAEKRTIDGKLYYALYFGKSNKGSRRYNQHTSGTVGNSTIRHTVYGLLFPGQKYDPHKEPKINDIVRQCYCEWVAIDDADCAECAKEPEESKGANWIGCLESMCIALGKYPLNVDGNPAISKDWRKHLIKVRKDSKKERKSQD